MVSVNLLLAACQALRFEVIADSDGRYDVPAQHAMNRGGLILGDVVPLRVARRKCSLHSPPH
eukprot:11751315-Prorocentrum_lima.AAC.1